jgi:hypothetical protein
VRDELSEPPSVLVAGDDDRAVRHVVNGLARRRVLTSIPRVETRVRFGVPERVELIDDAGRRRHVVLDHQVVDPGVASGPVLDRTTQADIVVSSDALLSMTLWYRPGFTEGHREVPADALVAVVGSGAAGAAVGMRSLARSAVTAVLADAGSASSHHLDGFDAVVHVDAPALELVECGVPDGRLARGRGDARTDLPSLVAHRLRERTGAGPLRRALLDGLELHDDALRVRRALRRLRAARSVDGRERELLADLVDRIDLTPEFHVVELVDALARAVAGGLDRDGFDVGTLRRFAERSTVRGRLGLARATSDGEVIAALATGTARWRAVANDGATGVEAARIATTMVRIHELLHGAACAGAVRNPAGSLGRRPGGGR